MASAATPVTGIPMLTATPSVTEKAPMKKTSISIEFNSKISTNINMCIQVSMHPTYSASLENM